MTVVSLARFRWNWPTLFSMTVMSTSEVDGGIEVREEDAEEELAFLHVCAGGRPGRKEAGPPAVDMVVGPEHQVTRHSRSRVKHISGLKLPP